MRWHGGGGVPSQRCLFECARPPTSPLCSGGRTAATGKTSRCKSRELRGRPPTLEWVKVAGMSRGWPRAFAQSLSIRPLPGGQARVLAGDSARTAGTARVQSGQGAGPAAGEAHP